MASILVIDDEESMRQLLRLVLEAAGHQVMEAPNGRVGLAMYADKATDIVITDIGMPEMNGLEMIAELTRSFRDVKILVISGAPSHELERAKRLGACETLPKPFHLDQLLDAVRAEIAH
jgi:DNA-binding NtrC family response regulator